MPTYNLSNPEPSDAAKAVAKEDADLRTWLGVGATDRAFRPFWDPAYATPGGQPGPRGPVDNGWGRPFDLADWLEDVFDPGAVTTGQSKPQKSAS